MDTLTSCVAREPLAKLAEEGNASVLNYNVPQSIAYDAVSYLKLSVPRDAFAKPELEAPQTNYWTLFDREDIATSKTIKSIIVGEAYSKLVPLQFLSLNANSLETPTASGLNLKAGNVAVSTKSFSFATDFIAGKVAEGFMPKLFRRPSGQQALRFVQRPSGATPALYLVMHIKMVSYLGDYGAGPCLKTFSLLPGEKTTISIRNYQQISTTSTASQSILDSYSTSIVEDLQQTVETNTSYGYTTTETDVNSMSAELTANAGAKVNLEVVEVGGGFEASGELSSVNTTTQALTTQIDTLVGSVTQHTQTADSLRQIEINTETSTTTTEETEETTTRTIENINKSRVLNFVFRQLLQEYITITYLEDVTVFYTNGYSESSRTATLATLESLLKEVLASDKAVAAIRSSIYEHLCNIEDYTGTKVPFIEQVTVKTTNCIETNKEPRSQRYVRKRKGLKQDYEGYSVDGIILDVTNRTLRTSSIAVDAFLGQGECLDCYNQNLQLAAYKAAHLENDKTTQMLEIISSISDSAQKAALYKKVFGECCDVPQSCCCCKSSTETSA